MKRLVLILAAVITAAVAVPTPAEARGGIGISFGVFYSSLGSQGEWISVDAGVYAWRPRDVAMGWRPYWFGRWAWTSDGWYWDSDEPWAWATYHYGRWYYDDYYGWIWIPGYEWAPAWVEWRYGGDYIGWAPLGPYAVFNPRFGVTYSRRWVTPYHYWSFVNCRYLTHDRVHTYVYRTDDNTRFIGRTRTGGSVRSENGRVITRGPDASYVERRGNVRVPRVTMVDVGSRDEARVIRSGENERIGVYRPRVEERFDQRIERPDGVRDRERLPSLDTRALDARRREVARESGRDSRGREPDLRDYRESERPMPPSTPQVRPENRSGRENERPRIERRSIERRSEGSPSAPGSVSRDTGRQAPPRIERPSNEDRGKSRSEGRENARPAPSRRTREGR